MQTALLVQTAVQTDLIGLAAFTSHPVGLSSKFVALHCCNHLIPGVCFQLLSLLSMVHL